MTIAWEKGSVVRPEAQVREGVTDKRYCSWETELALKHLGQRIYVSELDYRQQRLKLQVEKQKVVYAHRRQIRGARGETVAVPVERTGGTTDWASVRDERSATDFCPRPRQCSHAAVRVGLRFQSGFLDAPLDRSGYPPAVSRASWWFSGRKFSAGAAWGACGMLPGVRSARFSEIPARIPSLHYLSVNVQTEH